MIVMVSTVILFSGSFWSQAESLRDPATNHWLEAVTQFKQMRIANGASVNPIKGASAFACPGGAAWKQIGPSPLIIDPPNGADGQGPDSGAVMDIAIDPRGTTDQTIYIAANDGGIWKTTDGGLSWQPKTDYLLSLSMGAVALDPANPSIVYAGTGNIFNNGFIKGIGIYKSLNGGDQWTLLNPLGTFTSLGITRIVVLPGNVVLVGTQIYGSANGGLYRSVDGGVNFGNNPPLFNNGTPVLSGYVTDIDMDTASPTTVYGSIYGIGVFKSTDAGATFPVNLFTPATGGPASHGYIALSQSTLPNNQTVYLNVQILPASTVAMYKSINGGSSWTQVTLTADNGSCQCNYDQVVGVDPQDANRVYFGTRALYMVSDGGAGGLANGNRIDLNKVHADQHALTFSPPNHRPGPAPTRLYNGTDGGIATTANSGANWTPLNGSPDCAGPDTAIATVLFRQIDIGRGSVANNRYTYGAAQDLGIESHRAECSGTPWLSGIGGDGSTVAVDPRDPTQAIGESGGFTRSTGNGKSWTKPNVGLPAVPTLLYFDPNGGNAYAIVNLYQVYRSVDSGASFVPMSTLPPGGVSIPAISIAKIDSNTIWVGRGDGTVSHTSNANAGALSSWLNVSVTGAPIGQPVTGIVMDPFNTALVVVIYPTGQAFMTTDSGKTWSNISGNLPNLRLNSVVIDPNTSPHTIIVATDAGVVRTANYGASWEVLGVGLPTVECTSLAIDIGVIPSLLRVGTFGRSAFELAYDRLYVDWRNSGAQDGTLEHPFRTVRQALDAPTNGDAKFINIQAGDYRESPLSIVQCAFLNALNGSVHIH